MTALPSKVESLLDDLSLFEDRSERFQVLIEFADRFQEVPERIAQCPFDESHRVKRCESDAYVWTEPLDNGTLKYHFAVENPQGISAKAMAVILDETLSGEVPDEVLKLTPDIVFRIFGKEISMGKGQGLMGMVDLVKYLTRQATAEQ